MCKTIKPTEAWAVVDEHGITLASLEHLDVYTTQTMALDSCYAPMGQSTAPVVILSKEEYERIYALITRALAEPYGTQELVEAATILERMG